MIKFIATDLDGTLLDGEGALPSEIFPLVARLSECGILFAPASGRQYANLKKLFFPVWEKLLFICENRRFGAPRRGNFIPRPPYPYRSSREHWTPSGGPKGSIPFSAAPDNAYIEDTDEPFRTRAREPYSNCLEVDNLDEVIDREPVCKISVYNTLRRGNMGRKSCRPIFAD